MTMGPKGLETVAPPNKGRGPRQPLVTAAGPSIPSSSKGPATHTVRGKRLSGSG